MIYGVFVGSCLVVFFEVEVFSLVILGFFGSYYDFMWFERVCLDFVDEVSGVGSFYFVYVVVVFLWICGYLFC